MKTNKLFKTFLTAGLVATTLLTGCSSQSSSEPVKIGIPSDATNGGRGLLLLEKAGLIEVDDKAGWAPELKDVTKYKYKPIHWFRLWMILEQPQSMEHMRFQLD